MYLGTPALQTMILQNVKFRKLFYEIENIVSLLNILNRIEDRTKLLIDSFGSGESEMHSDDNIYFRWIALSAYLQYFITEYMKISDIIVCGCIINASSS